MIIKDRARQDRKDAVVVSSYELHRLLHEQEVLRSGLTSTGSCGVWEAAEVKWAHMDIS